MTPSMADFIAWCEKNGKRTKDAKALQEYMREKGTIK